MAGSSEPGAITAGPPATANAIVSDAGAFAFAALIACRRLHVAPHVEPARSAAVVTVNVCGEAARTGIALKATSRAPSSAARIRERRYVPMPPNPPRPAGVCAQPFAPSGRFGACLLAAPLPHQVRRIGGRLRLAVRGAAHENREVGEILDLARVVRLPIPPGAHQQRPERAI